LEKTKDPGAAVTKEKIMWIDCPKCGKPKAAWEDDQHLTFCGECEEEYQQAEMERQAMEKEMK